MSEEILKALMQLFALIIKQDGGMLSSEREYVVNFLEKQLSHDSVNEYLELFDRDVGPLMDHAPVVENKPPSLKDSVKIFGICKQINRTLNQSQKVVVLMRLYELVNADKRYTLQRMNIINTVAEVFRILPEEFKSIELFVKQDTDREPGDSSILVLKLHTRCPDCENDPDREQLDANFLVILWIPSVDLYFIKHYSDNPLLLNGLPLDSGKIYTMAKGSSLKYQHGQPLYYSDISAHYLLKKSFHKISLEAENLVYKFPGGQTGINNINIAEREGNLIGIMGSSGAGKTTLLNLLSGIYKPASGTVKINGIDLNKKSGALDGIIGYVPQDDMLMEDLTVFENLYYAACLCFKNLTRQEITHKVDTMLRSLGLYEKRDLKVGSVLNKVISGGQRKRLNIALELIREPLILFLDEPTSGLSSRDSENVIDLLRELTLKSKLIFTVVHQPSSEIYKVFDRIIILDEGGEMIYYGNPIEALIHFKTIDEQVESHIGECPTCGNINPETIFNIVEKEIVDEFGRYTGVRKRSTSEWAEKYIELHPAIPFRKIKTRPRSNLNRPNLLKQLLIFLRRDLSSKISNRQYVLLTLLEAPVLGFILSYIIRYIADPDSKNYIFRENENIPIYIFMCLIVALFLGLITSAEEIFKDKKIRKREHFLNLSNGSYLAAKVIILFSISALQSFLFLIVANPLLGIKGLFFQYWFALFTTATFANILGLNVSAAFNSAITIYIIVPLLMIPMMVLSGAMFQFDKLNRTLGSVDKVPWIAEFMPTKWTYEALMVTQFKDNEYDKLIYDMNKTISVSDYNTIYRIPELENALNTTVLNFRRNLLSEENPSRLPLLKNEIIKMSQNKDLYKFKEIDKLNFSDFNNIVAEKLYLYLDSVNSLFMRKSNSADIRKDRFISANREKLDRLFNQYHNDRLEEIVRKIYEKNKILEFRDRLVQNYDPIYRDPPGNEFLAFRSHFFAPTKVSGGLRFETYTFNMIFVWFMSFVFYVLLYYNVLERIINSFSKR
ncbi:MAG: ATP-binding cassette domain-containing protein [Bacteroidales bacterium]|nr:ATP-binding cassette domain-containing protein [Bacteroidales bacterium]